MIGILEKRTETYDSDSQTTLNVMYPYTNVAYKNRNITSKVELNNSSEESFNGQIDFITTSGSFHYIPFWCLPVAPELPINPPERLLTFKQAQELAQTALYLAEERRQREWEEEAKYWADID